MTKQLPPQLESLAETCRRQRVREKWLVAPNRRIGIQWVDRLALHGAPVLNLHVFSLRSLAIQLANPPVAEQTSRIVGEEEAAWWIDQAWRSLPDTRRGALTKLPAQPALADAVQRSFAALRMSGVSSESLRAAELPDQLLDVADKPRELADLLDHYLVILRRHHRIDMADATKLATRQLQDHGLPRDVTLLAPEGLEQWELERAMLSAAGSRLQRLASKPVSTDSGSDASRLGSLLRPGNPLPPRSDGSVSVFRAVGEANEVREIFRRILSEGWALDQVELLVTDPSTYVPLCIELSHTWNAHASTTNLPLTFSDGLPASYTRPGKALAQWLRWVDSSCAQAILVEMYHEGLFENLPGQGRRQQHQQRSKHRVLRRTPASRTVVSTRDLARMLRDTPIGREPERYLPALDRRIQAGRVRWRRLLAEEESVETEDATAGERAEQAARQRRKLLQLRLLRRHVKQLLSMIPRFDDPIQDLRIVDDYLKRHARHADPADTAARRRLRTKVAEALEWLETASPGSWDVRGWLSHLVENTRVFDSGPRPGAVHVTHVLSGGHSGRPRVFIAGMDDSRFPGLGMQDPIVLDEERAALSERLPLGADEPQRRVERLTDTLERLPEDARVTISCPARSLDEDREMFASPALVNAQRIAPRDEPDWIQPVSFTPKQPEHSINETEWWLSRLTHARSDYLTPLFNRLPHLASGRAGVISRHGSLPSPHNGFVPEASADLSPWVAESGQPDGPRATSASAMETAGACPLRYFFRYGLGIRATDESASDEDRWLDPLQFGSLLHEVFRAFMAERVSEGELPSFARHHRQLAILLKESLATERLAHPPPHESAFREQARLMQITARIFLEEEERRAKTFQPRFFEAAMGFGDSKLAASTDMDVADPIPISVDDGKTLRARGHIDRVDQSHADEHVFEVWDYKTGSSSRYNLQKPFSRGRHIQNIFYALLSEAALRQTVDPLAVVVRFGYFFPGVKAWGARVAWPTDELQEGTRILRLLGDVMGSGAYLPTWKAEDCDWCDYATACGPQLFQITSASRSQAQNASTGDAERLAAWKELQNVK